MVLLLFLVPAAVLTLARHRLQPAWQSPTIVVVGFIEVVGVLGYLLHDNFTEAGGGTISSEMTPDLAQKTAALFAATASCIAVAATASIFSRPAPSEPRQRFTPLTVDDRLVPKLLLLAAVPLAIMLIAGNPSRLVDRDLYLLGGPGVASVVINVAPGAVAACGYVYAHPRINLRMPAAVITALYALLLVAVASRGLCLLPVAFALGVYLVSMSRRARLGLLVAGTLAFGLLPVPLFFRSQDRHGLEPYWHAIPNFFDRGIDYVSAMNNVLIAFPISGKTAFEAPTISTQNLLVELNPAPGTMAGWYQIKDQMRLNLYTPYSAIGEAANAGWLSAIVLWLCVGFVLAWLDVRCRRLVTTGGRVPAAVVVGLAGIFAVSSVEYNLRNAQRNLIYAVLFILALEALRWLRKNVEAAELLTNPKNTPPLKDERPQPSKA